MHASVRRIGWTVGLLFVALALPACGGGGPDDVPVDDPLFEGAYGFVLLEWIQTDEYPRCTMGILTPNGAGGLAYEALGCRQAGVDESVAIGPWTYVETSPGRIVVTDGRSRQYHADMASGGGMLAGTTRDGGTQPALLVLVRRAATTSLSNLAGSWMEMTWMRDRFPGQPLDEVGDAAYALYETFFSTGECFIDGGYEIKLEEYFFIPAIGAATTHMEAWADGRIVWNRAFDDEATHVGSASADENLLLLGGQYNSEATGPTICVRASQPGASAPLSGAFRHACFGSTTLGHHVRWGTTTFGAAGAGSSTFDHNVEGIVIGTGSADFTHTVEASGHLEILWDDEAVPLHGMVGASGAYAILCGGFVDGKEAEIHVLLR